MLSEDNRVIKRTARSCSEIEAAIQQVLSLFSLQMHIKSIEFEFQNNMVRGDSYEESYIANWEMLQQAIFHPVVNAVKFSHVRGKVSVTISISK
mmetsp:Transcript_44540/g.59094  ORF Transcript_44540/g.59094 Transcript_44540/m.59094 type:complete len:94 (+) Transcript_44540:124-405(+)